MTPEATASPETGDRGGEGWGMRTTEEEQKDKQAGNEATGLASLAARTPNVLLMSLHSRVPVTGVLTPPS